MDSPLNGKVACNDFNIVGEHRNAPYHPADEQDTLKQSERELN
ncbi:MAG TPA: hypothetical protein VHS34_15340 [Terriglobales bacterium]|jgi:hypothetical protein|nr:hypothetical protein [Terriglobales bacterium]